MKIAFSGLFVAGFVACSVFGIGPVLRQVGGDWMSLPMLLGSGLGVGILAVAAIFVSGFRPAVLPSDAVLVGTLAILIAVKVLVGALAMNGAFGTA
jgi:hypothetical protein